MSSKAAAMPEARDDNEPSMEEILASIRKIIADDSLGTKKDEPVARKVPPKKEPEPEPEMIIDDPEPVATDVEMDSDVLDLASVATVASQPQAVMVDKEEEPEAIPEVAFEPVPVVMTAPPPAAEPAPARNVAMLEERILSDNAGSLVSQAFQTLSRHTAMPAVGRSLEDVVVELLRPMLRGWLDDHLPGIVEKLVKAEIERVARGG
jgi:uncharacterized protein